MKNAFEHLALLLILSGILYILVYLKSNPSLLNLTYELNFNVIKDINLIRNIGILLIIAGFVSFYVSIKASK